MAKQKMKVTFGVHYPTAEELVEDRDAVSLIKYIIYCYSEGKPMEAVRLHGMMDRMYLYNWSVAGMMMYRKVVTPEQARYEDLEELLSELDVLSETHSVHNHIQDIEMEKLGMDGSFGYNDVKEFHDFEFFLTDYGLETFMDVLRLENRKAQRFMTTEELQSFQDSGRLELWITEPKHRTVTYKKSMEQMDASFAVYTAKPKNKEKVELLHDKEEQGIVGWLAPDGKFIKCNFAEHALTAYNILNNHEHSFDDAEEIFIEQGYIKFWYMYTLGYGVIAKKEYAPTKAQRKWYERNIEIINKRQISSMELMLEKRKV